MEQNNQQIYDLVVVGAGISGIVSANIVNQHYKKQDKEIKIKILEATNRIGGRLYSPDGIELGATWTWDGESNLHQIAKEQEIKLIPTDSYYGGEYKFEGGVQQIPIKIVNNDLPKNILELNTIVNEVTFNEQNNQINIQGESNDDEKKQFSYISNNLIIAMPPTQILKRIQFQPNLDANKIKYMKQTSTWMSDAFKIVGIFKQKIWKNLNHPLYDISQPSLNIFAAKAFLVQQMQLGKLPNEALEKQYIQILSQHYKISENTIKENLKEIKIKKWFDDPFVHSGQLNVGSNGNAMGYKELKTPIYKNKVQFAGTETENYSGHIEGAVISAQRVAQQIIKNLEEQFKK